MKNSSAVPATTSTPAAAATNRKERSVLQAKLTKLAIQIGYAGLLYTAAAAKSARSLITNMTSTSRFHRISVCKRATLQLRYLSRMSPR